MGSFGKRRRIGLYSSDAIPQHSDDDTKNASDGSQTQAQNQKLKVMAAISELY